MAHICYSYDGLSNLVNMFTSLNALPGHYSPLLPPLYDQIKENKQLSLQADKRCIDIFAKWDNGGDDIEEEVLKRCMDMWLTIHGEDYVLSRPPPFVPNVTIQEAEATDYVDRIELERIEFDPVTGDRISNPLRNLIIEEVEASEFISPDDEL